MNVRILFIGLFLVAGCRERDPARAPVFFHFPHVLYPDGEDSILLKTDGRPGKWQFVLLSQRQPAALTAKVHDGICVIPLRLGKNFYQGPATFCCIRGTDRFFYPMRLMVEEVASRHEVKKQYQDPKTVNPDSSLLQQRLCFDMDSSRNILPYPVQSPGMWTPYFYHYFLRMPPHAGTLLVQPPSNVSAVYVQPGTVRHLDIRGSFLPATDHYVLWVDDLRDSYGNPIADGTMVDILFRLQGQVPAGDDLSWKMETPVYQGRVTAYIPAGTSKHMHASVIIGTVQSRTIDINRTP